MKRNTALFGASLVAGVAAASGLIMTSTASSAAPGDTFYGVNWSDSTSGESSGGWTTGSYADPYGFEFSGSATAGSGTFQLDGSGTTQTVTTTCVDGAPSVTVAGGGATGVHTGGSVSLAEFTGDDTVIGTVTFATKTVGGHSVGAYIDLGTAFGPGTYVALTGADCQATTTSSTTSSSTTTPPSSSTTPPPSSSTTAPPSSTTTAPPSSTTTAPPSSTTTAPPTTTPPTTPPPTTEPPTPTPTTTTLPVTG